MRPVPNSWRRAPRLGGIFVLNEASQVVRITSGADRALQSLGYAKRDVKDIKVGGLIDRLQDVVPRIRSISRPRSAR